ncbi:hypothetical protein [Pyrobaculum neutrophilum]|uniref:Uncharacterized protein n=1 Tax=Pyrobaculum neutrophilum (strain DSM 2338 / JCM 9278 / NBRC 100436 / V24Sta) TaxID=444157 RepID=B1YDL6_PYRNV|nr:hypothetical protein [Pyrobaculum neutrophilum]ACB39879.1 hypothetical protein Tneu_0943 [Pyrobaculum neutrophilum V24Sta]
MDVVFVGKIPRRYVEALKRFGFRVSDRIPPEGSAVVVIYGDCEEAAKRGYACFTQEELDGFVKFLFSYV